MQSFLRLGLLLAVLLVSVIIIAAHGARGIAVVVALVLAVTVPRTRVWSICERFMVRLTGSRRRAAATVLAVVIGTLIAINVYELVHG